MKKILLFSLLLLFALTLFGKKIASLNEVVQPFYMTIGANRLYVVEKKIKVHIYDFDSNTNKISYIKSFGKEGQGPGEFSFIHRMKVLKDKLIIPTMGKYAKFTLDGKFLEERRINIPVQKNKIERVGDHFVALNRESWRDQKHITDRQTIKLYDQELNFMKVLKILYVPTIYRKINLLSPICVFSVLNNQIYIITGDKNITIEIFDQFGNLLVKKITQLGSPKITEEFKKNRLNFYKNDKYLGRFPGGWKYVEKMTYFPGYCPEMEYAWIFGQHIYVKTYLRKNKLAEYVIFDLTGNKLKSGYAYNSGPVYQGQPFFFIKDEIIYLKLNEEDDNWELYREQIQFSNQ